jgi:LysM repeat protein
MNNNESPLIPQGSFMEQKNKGRARVRIAVFVVLAIHGIGLMALLMQGCKPNVPAEPTPQQETNTAVAPFQPTNEPVLPETNTFAPPVTSNQAPVVPEPTTTVQPTTTAPTAAVTEHKIVRGDTFAGLAKQFNVSVKAIEEANPGVNPSRLQIGQSIKIPAPAPTTGQSAPTADAANGSQTYTVKSGDSLTKIAAQFGTTVKALQSANNLKTDRIRVGQPLKIPVKPVAPGFAAPTSNTPAR